MGGKLLFRDFQLRLAKSVAAAATAQTQDQNKGQDQEGQNQREKEVQGQSSPMQASSDNDIESQNGKSVTKEAVHMITNSPGRSSPTTVDVSGPTISASPKSMAGPSSCVSDN